MLIKVSDAHVSGEPRRSRVEPPPFHRSAHQLESAESVRAGRHPCNKANKMGESEPTANIQYCKENDGGRIENVPLQVHFKVQLDRIYLNPKAFLAKLNYPVVHPLVQVEGQV